MIDAVLLFLARHRRRHRNRHRHRRPLPPPLSLSLSLVPRLFMRTRLGHDYAHDSPIPVAFVAR